MVDRIRIFKLALLMLFLVAVAQFAGSFWTWIGTSVEALQAGILLT